MFPLQCGLAAACPVWNNEPLGNLIMLTTFSITDLFVLGLLFLLLLVIVGGVVLYNRLVRLRQRSLNAFSQIDVQLKRRHDLIPNLVETVKGYLGHEKQTLEAVIAARQAAVAAERAVGGTPRDGAALAQLASAEQTLAGLLGQFRVLVESYPDLKADQQTLRLMEELSSAENRIAFARQGYNDSVMAYNAARQSFPAVLIAGSLGFVDASLFELEDPAARHVPTVALGR